MDIMILILCCLLLFTLTKQRQLNFGCVIEVKKQHTQEQLTHAVEQARADALKEIEQVKADTRNEILNNIDRIYSDAELAAKSFGYWEKQIYTAQSEAQRSFCYKNAKNAQILLIRAAGDFVPDLAKCAIEIKVKGKENRDQRVKAPVVPLYPS